MDVILAILGNCYLDLLLPNSSAQSGLETNSCITAIACYRITDRVCEFMTEAKLEISKLQGIGTDGASTVIGCKNWVVTHFKNLVPSAVVCTVHWRAAYKLNLASSQASNSA